MSNKELLKTFFRIVMHLNDNDCDSCDINITAPDGGIIKCHFDVELPENDHD